MKNRGRQFSLHRTRTGTSSAHWSLRTLRPPESIKLPSSSRNLALPHCCSPCNRRRNIILFKQGVKLIILLFQTLRKCPPHPPTAPANASGARPISQPALRSPQLQTSCNHPPVMRLEKKEMNLPLPKPPKGSRRDLPLSPMPLLQPLRL